MGKVISMIVTNPSLILWMAEHKPQAMNWLYLSSMPRIPEKNFSPPFISGVMIEGIRASVREDKRGE